MAVGDRACLGITTVLTEIFLLEFSNQGMPKVSYMKAAELFLIVSFSFIFLALVESAIVYKATFWSLLKEKKKKRVKLAEEPGEPNKVIYTYRLIRELIERETNNKINASTAALKPTYQNSKTNFVPRSW